MIIEFKGKVIKSGVIGKGSMQGMKYYSLLVPRPDGMADVVTLFSEKDYKINSDISVMANAFVRSATEIIKEGGK